MPGALEPIRHNAPALSTRAPALRTTRVLNNLEHNTLVRRARVQAEAIITGEKMEEIDYVTRQALAGQSMLAKWRDTLAAGDPFLADELRFFVDTARLGKGELIADLVADFSREGGL